MHMEPDWYLAAQPPPPTARSANLPRGQEIQGLHRVRNLFQGAILRLVRLTGLSVRLGLYGMDMANQGQFWSAAAFRNSEIVRVRWLDDERMLFRASDVFEGSGRQVGGQGLFMVGYDERSMRDLIQRHANKVFIDFLQLKNCRYYRLLSSVVTSKR